MLPNDLLSLRPAPDVFEPPRRQRSITRGRVDRAVAEIGLQRSGIDALIGQRVAAGMPEHMWVDLEADLGFVAGAGEQLGEAGRGERSTPLRGKDEGRRRLALQLSQRPQFIAEERMRGFLAALGPAHMHRAGLKRDRRPLQIAELRHSQAVPEADQDHGRIALAMAVAFDHLHQAFDLVLGEVLAVAAHVPVATSAQRDCP